MRALLDEVLDSPLVPQVAALIQKRLGRPLEPFDLWYDGFRSRSSTGGELDALTAQALPDRGCVQEGHPAPARGARLLAEKARFLAEHIVVDPARGAGHALQAAPRRQSVRTGIAAPAHAHRAGRHGLQGLQHRHPRDGPQRRAGVLALRRRPHAAGRRARTPPSPRRWPSSSRTATSSCSACASPTPKPSGCARSTTFWDDLRDRRRRRWSIIGGLALDVRSSRRDARAAARGGGADRPDDLEQVLRAGAGQARQSAARRSTRT